MKIYDINGSSLQLTQWDTNRTVSFDKPSETDIVVHIFNNHNKAAKVVPTTVSQDKISCVVPNELLQEARPIYIMLYAKDGGEGKVIGSNVISVERKAKPEDYTFVENIEYTDWVQLTADAKLLMETMAASKRACDQATLDANTATDGASKVDIQMTPNPTGVTIAVTNRNGKVTEAVLDTVSQLKTWKDIQTVVRQGNAKNLIKPGDIFNANYKYNGKTYTMPWHVCDVRNIKTPEGETKEAVIIQSHLVSPIEVPFDTYEAFYVAKEELPAGTYHIVPDAWSKIKAGDVWSFTLTKPLPVGGVLCGFENVASYGTESTYTIKSYATVSDLTEIEAVTARVGTEGTLLGNWVAAGNAELNSIQRVSYGYGRWRDSFQRQWLNNKGTGWWKPQNEYDRPPSNVESLEGYMTGFDDEFLNVLRPFVSVTAKNNVTDGGGTEETADVFALPALEKMYITKQVAGEGEPFTYWKEVSGKAEPFPWYKETPELVHLDVNNTARYVRLRSANVSGADDAWSVYPSGYVGSSSARNAFASAPLAAIY